MCARRDIFLLTVISVLYLLSLGVKGYFTVTGSALPITVAIIIAIIVVIIIVIIIVIVVIIVVIIVIIAAARSALPLLAHLRLPFDLTTSASSTRTTTATAIRSVKTVIEKLMVELIASGSVRKL